MMRPTVLHETETLRCIQAKRLSLARFGDGEIALATVRHSSRSQVYDPELGRRLCEVARSELPGLLVAIPPIFEAIPPGKVNWLRWRKPERMVLWQKGRCYGSAFVGRPDFYGGPYSAEYWALFRSLWDGRPAIIVRGNDKVPPFFANAEISGLVVVPNWNAWADYERILAECLEKAQPWGKAGIVLAMAGATATVLAHDLQAAGVQCLDVGKAPRFAAKEMAP